MLRELIKIANKLDRLGHTVEADMLDDCIKKMAQDMGSELDGFIIDGDIDWNKGPALGLSDLERLNNMSSMEGSYSHTNDKYLKYVADNDIPRGTYNEDNGSISILPKSEGVNPKVYIAAGETRSFSGRDQRESFDNIIKVLNMAGYKQDFMLPVVK